VATSGAEAVDDGNVSLGQTKLHRPQLRRTPSAPSLAAIRRRPAFREALIEGRLTGSSLIEIYKADNDLLRIRPLAEESLADLENLADGGGRNDESFKAGEMALHWGCC